MAILAFESRIVPAVRAASLALLLACAPAFADADLAVRLSSGESPGEIVFELANEGDETVSVLRTGTPLEPLLSEDAFAVRRSVKGWPVVEGATYTGRAYKRGAPRPEDFVELRPGRTLSSTVALGAYYAVPEAGDYRVSFDGAIRVAPASDGAAGPTGPRTRRPAGLVDVRPGSGTIELELLPGQVDVRALPPAFGGCDAGQQDGIVEATSAAEGIAGDALEALLSTPEAQRPSAQRYARWFGAYSPDRYATVANGFDAISRALSGETLGFDCTCTEEGAFAYVYPFQPYGVYLCPQFFRADTLGTDSRAGTIVHELSHFQVLVGTDDHRYGTSAVAALASTDPDLSIDNADSYEYFAENTPALPMGTGGGTAPPPGPQIPDPTPTPSDGPGLATLELGVPARGRLALEEIALYQVSGADAISLSSLSGDVDLYVFDDPSLDEASLVCSAAAYSEESTLDACELPPAATHYALVYGFTAADYEIVAEAVDTSAPQEPTALPPGGSGGSGGGGAGGGASGGPNGETLGADEFAVYTVTVPARVELTSSAGDADLYVFLDESLSPDGLVCASERPSGADGCELTGSGTAYVVVYSAAGSRYSLAVTQTGGGVPGSSPAPAPGPAEDDPGTVVAGAPRPDGSSLGGSSSGGSSSGGSSSGGSSGGGALGWAGLGLLGAALRGRRTRRAPGTHRS